MKTDICWNIPTPSPRSGAADAQRRRRGPATPRFRRLLAPVVLATLAAFALAATAEASCGSSSCPLDLNALNRPDAGHFSLDLSLQSIDQNRPQIGTHRAPVGAIHGAEHDEVRTVNRLATLLLRYAPSEAWQFSVALPFVSREHLHLEGNAAESWKIRGAGDLQLQARARLLRHEQHGALWAIAGVKSPTGRQGLTNAEGSLAEVPIQPGNGATDFTVGLAYETKVMAPTGARGALGNEALVPLSASIAFRRNGRGTGRYRFGDEWQFNAGTAWPLSHHVEILGQLNARRRARDWNPEVEGLDPFTGSRVLYVTPGLRFSAGRSAVYGLVQFPAYQDVNGIQLTAARNYVAGVQTRF
jgi:hypothetical protein